MNIQNTFFSLWRNLNSCTIYYIHSLHKIRGNLSRYSLLLRAVKFFYSPVVVCPWTTISHRMSDSKAQWLGNVGGRVTKNCPRDITHLYFEWLRQFQAGFKMQSTILLFLSFAFQFSSIHSLLGMAFHHYRGEVISWVKGSVCFVLKFALPPFPTFSPLECKFQNKTHMVPLTQ